MSFSRWPLEQHLRKLLQKTTSPAYDANTDSNEALSEKIDGTDGTIVQGSATAVTTSSLKNIVAGAAGNTFGVWASIDASTAADVWISHVAVTPQTTILGADTTERYILEVGTGASPSEAAKMRFAFTYRVDFTSNVGYVNRPPIVFALPKPIKVASGTRIAARCSCSVAAAKSLSVGVSYYLGV